MERLLTMKVIEIPPAPRDHAWYLEHYLALWASWMQSKDEDLPQGCPEDASGLTPYVSLDFDAMCEHMDTEHAQQTHVAIWRLHQDQRNAIYVERGIIAYFDEPTTYARVLEQAKAQLMRELVKMGLWFGD